MQEGIQVVPTRYHIFKVDNGTRFSWLGFKESREQAAAEATRRHAKNPHSEYRVVNANLGAVDIIPAIPETSPDSDKRLSEQTRSNT